MSIEYANTSCSQKFSNSSRHSYNKGKTTAPPAEIRRMTAFKNFAEAPEGMEILIQIPDLGRRTFGDQTPYG